RPARSRLLRARSSGGSIAGIRSLDAIARRAVTCGAAEARRSAWFSGGDASLNGGGLMRQFAAIAIGGVWLLTMGLGVAQAGPFGGDDPGCVPSTQANLKCSDGAYKAFIKAYKAVIKCHIKQADATFKGAPADDEPCENTAKSKLDIALGKLDCSGSPGVLT